MAEKKFKQKEKDKPPTSSPNPLVDPKATHYTSVVDKEALFKQN